MAGHAPGDPFEARFDDALAAIEKRRREEQARKGLWLSHHRPDQLDRCVVIRGRHVCRRCLTLYGVSLVVTALSLAGWPPWPAELDTPIIWGLSIIGTLEFVAEQLGWVRYRASRQVAATALVALAFGRALAYEIEDRWDWYFWGPILVFGTIWFIAARIGETRRVAAALGQDGEV
ncbi:MAG: hypothetical protein OEW42_03035 [Acidimicrobiia bacterium]|nr:hypothetical protein [Acidimicrobiia bacterium]